MTCTMLISARCVQRRRQLCAPDRVHFRGYTPYLTLYVHGRRYDVHARPRVSCVSCVRAHATQRHTDHRVACDCETAVAVHSTFIALTLSASGDQTSNDHIYSMCHVWGGTLAHLKPPHTQSGPRPRKACANPHDRAPAAQRRCRTYSHATRLRPDAVRPRLHYPLAQLALMHQTQ